MISLSAEELYQFFQKHAICETLTLDEVTRLRSYLKEKNFSANETITDAGEVGESLGFIYSGKVLFTSPEQRENPVVGKQAKGTLIGEMSFFDRKPRNLRMVAGPKGVKFLELTRPMYDRVKVEEPFIAVNVLENAIVSLDNLVRHMGSDISALDHYMYGYGKH